MWTVLDYTLRLVGTVALAGIVAFLAWWLL